MADEVAELQLFVEIVRAGNLSAAARALNSSPAAMSRGLTTLESPLSVRLVTRTSRSFELTEEGQLFYERCARIVGDIAGLDVIDDGRDIALRIGLPSDSSVIARKVLTAKRITCASPTYFKEHGTPAKPSDLLHHDCIRLVRGRRVMDAWVFQEQGKRFEVVVNGTLTTTSGEVVHDWVRAGK
jgi:DNA-binding transcriptional LysR family regulator